MKKLFTLITIIFTTLNVFSFSISSNTLAKPSNVIDNPKQALAIKLLATMPTKQIEQYIGRKLNFKERLGIKLLKYKAKHNNNSKDEASSQKGKTSLTLGICALASFLIFPLAAIPLGILAIVNGNQAKKINPNDTNAKTGVILGIISLALLVVLIVLIVAIIAGLGGGF